MTDSQYYARSLEVQVYPHLRQALEILKDVTGHIAVDAGCGAGRDSLFLLAQGMTVHAFDKHTQAIARLREQGSEFLGKTLFTRICSFEQFDYPKASLINACSSLFFCHPSHFQLAWQRIVDSLNHSGIFCGHFMGPEDSWAKMERGDLSIHSRGALEDMLHEHFEIIDLLEWNAPGQTLLGKPKHWHTYSVLARKA